MVKNEIKVFARLKPERRRSKAVNYQIHRRPKSHSEEDFLVLTAPQKSVNEYIDNRPESWNFSFYKIFQEDANQQEIFENVARPVLDSVLCGYNGTIFAYGQTGSGKTYSITGDQRKYNDRGVLPRTLEYLFDVIRKKPENLYSIEISYLEIYNENGYDLLYPRHEIATRLDDFPKRVAIQEDETGILHLKNLSFHNVDNEGDALDLLALGETNRAISETPMNPQSSRSHCIFTIIVSMKKFGSDHHTKAKMHLVDLAGSERVYKCAITGIILTEAKHINLSLHYLEQVIVCLGQDNITHIPYRNSLLTAILRDSLGGNCLTTMLATLSVATFSVEETISTCRFAQRVALIKNDVNLVFEKDIRSENMFLKMEVERLKQEINRLSKNQMESTELLSEEEKKNLDHQISNFLINGSNMMWDKDPRKVQYCFKAMRMSLETGTRHKASSEMCSTDLQYYKNLVLQRDKEISLLIELLKKERANNQKKIKGVDQKVSQKLKLEKKHESKLPKETLHLATISLENNSLGNSNGSSVVVERKDAEIDETEIDVSPPMKLEQNCVQKEAYSVENDKIHTIMRSKNISSSSKRRISYSNPEIPQLDLNKITDNYGAGGKRVADKTETNEQFSGTYPKLLLQSTRRISVPDPKESVPQYFSSVDEFHQHDGIEWSTLKKTISKQAVENQNIEIVDFSKSSNKPNTAIIENKKIGSKESKDYLKKSYETTNRSNQTLPIYSPNTEIPIKQNSSAQTISFKNQTISKPINDMKTILSVQRQSEQDEKQDYNAESKSVAQSTNTENKKHSFKTPSLLKNIFCVTPSKIVESNQHSENVTESSILTYDTKPIKSTRSERKTVADLIASSRKSVESKEHLSEDKKVTEVVDVRPVVKTDYIESIEESNRKAFEKSLPLTGDPEIDEEIIAFYKAKRSGETY